MRGTRPPRPPSLRTRPQMRGNPANSATVFPHKATDAREPGQLGHRLSAQSHRFAGTRPTRPQSLRTKPQTRRNQGQLGHRLCAQGHRRGGTRPTRPHLSAQSHRCAGTRPQGHRCGEPGPTRPPSQLGPHLSAHGHRWGVNQHEKAQGRAGNQPARLWSSACAPTWRSVGA